MAIPIIGIAGIVEIVRLEEEVNFHDQKVHNLYINFVMIILGQGEWDIMATPIHPAVSGNAITCKFIYGVSADLRLLY